MAYRWIDLVTRKIDCNSITADEFAKAMFEDLMTAQNKYNAIYMPEHVANIIKGYEYMLNVAKKRATEYAIKKWKTESKRNEYINKEVENARKNYNSNKYYNGLTFFDFNVNPGEMLLSENCCISIDNITFDKLIKCFESIKDNKYFKKASGWKLSYECSENSFGIAFRPQIRLITDYETSMEMKKEADELAADIEKFYENRTYCGD